MKDRKLTAHEMGRLTPEEYRNRPESGIVVVLDNVRSAYNVGSAFRSADAFGADKMWLCGICATPPSAEIHKTALGAEDSVPWEHSADTLQVVRNLQSSGYTVIAVEQTINSVKLCAGWQLPPSAVSRTFDPTTDCVSGPPTPLPWAARVSGGKQTKCMLTKQWTNRKLKGL